MALTFFGLKERVIFIFIFLYPILCFAQKEQSIWYFGDKAGLDLTPITPKSLTGGSMVTKGGGATMSDALGNLLFYTDGVQVWNKNHQLMMDGTGLKGNPDATQTVIIVPVPLHRYHYYIFTTDSRKDNSPNALRYSEVDMTLDGGLGGVVNKNILLRENVSEKITAVLHDNNQDFWLLAHSWNTNDFIAYYITSSGISKISYRTSIGSVYSGSVTTGRGSFRLTAPYGYNYVVVALPDQRVFELLSFDGRTGFFSNCQNLSSHYSYAAYADFASVHRLYTVSINGKEIYEFNTQGNATAIVNSKRLIATGAGFGDLRLASDFLVYVVVANTNKLHSISYDTRDEPFYSKPSFLTENVVSLASDKTIGLPNTISTYAHRWWGWGRSGGNCLGDSVTFRTHFQNSVDSILWDFDDPASGISNFANDLMPTHVFKTPGKIFKIKATIYARGMVQNGNLTFDTRYAPNLGQDTAICPGHELILSHNMNGLKSFQWQDGSKNPTYTVTMPGIYWLGVVSEGNCHYRDSIVVKSLPEPKVELGNDTTMCVPKTLLLITGTDGPGYLWQDGSTNPYFTVKDPGTYHVTVTNEFGCSANDSIRVYYLTPPTIDLGNDTVICTGTELVLDVTLPGVSYIWQDGSTNSTFTVKGAGTYWVEGSIDVCAASDEIMIQERKGCIDNIFVPNVITPNSDGFNDGFIILDSEKDNSWRIEIYNRYGKLVYENKYYDNTWEADGLPAGVYYFLLRDKNGNKKLKGDISVIK